ncbi:type II toxin-antitoxin system prevent-host-death family antitoxin [Nocardioides sp. BGMRC 2183]|nr:type II toxin-antitoxin system prevent-host-death family antitoxin [Nocardioides sp. BGMRC 2183]
MVRVASRELRNDTAGVLRRVTAGERVEITVRGEAVASLGPLTRDQSPWTPKDVLVAKLARVQADPGLAAELAALDAETDDLGPLE